MNARATLLGAVCALAIMEPARADDALRGYAVPHGAAERALEATFIDVPSVEQSRIDIALITQHPHPAGSSGDIALGYSLRDLLRADGLDAALEPLAARIVQTKRLALGVFAPAAQTGRRRWPHHASDTMRVSLPHGDAGAGAPFDPASPDGDVRGPLVDLAASAAPGSTLAGAIVLAPRAAEPQATLAARLHAAGAVGLVLPLPASDAPADAGEREAMPTIVVDAVAFRALRDDARAGLWAHLAVTLTRRTLPLANVVATIRGTGESPPVVIAARRDADPATGSPRIAGLATLLEAGRGFGMLLRGGWQPRRTIVIAAWDGPAGAAAYAATLPVGAPGTAYLDADDAASGDLFAPVAAPALAPTVGAIAQEVRDATFAADAAVATTRLAPTTHPLGPSPLGPGFPIVAPRMIAPPHPGSSGPAHDDDVLARTAAQLYGVLALRLADADVVPYAFGSYVPPLRVEAAFASARASHTRDGSGTGGLRRAVDAYAGAARQVDARIALGAGPSPALLDRTRRLLDALCTGSDGRSPSAMPIVNAAIVADDPQAVSAAIADATEALMTATANLRR